MNNLPPFRISVAFALSAALHVALIHGLAVNVQTATSDTAKKSVLAARIAEISLPQENSPLKLPDQPAKQAVAAVTFSAPQESGASVHSSSYQTHLSPPLSHVSRSDPADSPLRRDEILPDRETGKTAEHATSVSTADVTLAPTITAHLLNPVHPAYPVVARAQNIEGRVTAQLLIDENGRVVKSSVVHAEPAGLFETSTLEALRNARFSPAKKNGVAVRSEKQFVVSYRLEGAAR